MPRDLWAPVPPVTIRGSGKILTPDGMELHPGGVEMVIHPAMSRDEVVSSEPEALRDRAREIVAGALQVIHEILT